MAGKEEAAKAAAEKAQNMTIDEKVSGWFMDAYQWMMDLFGQDVVNYAIHLFNENKEFLIGLGTLVGYIYIKMIFLDDAVGRDPHDK